ncbi:unnamed protein product [[Candida] boidinii]|uniref:Unnamed protein product n=1 Tax=Candida boidinii TaxID=5477 RepID=A0A9W6SY85_CANBO|nr:unnamed protein product [[Candida] boidinii]GMF00447.1 unnamed protein product [[Candida] boidinii]GMF53303.1 unnamed protein product [[Candida] boidinii]GMF99308.1 unnamed protein product [[Candida] boidinii]
MNMKLKLLKLKLNLILNTNTGESWDYLIQILTISCLTGTIHVNCGIIPITGEYSSLPWTLLEAFGLGRAPRPSYFTTVGYDSHHSSCQLGDSLSRPGFLCHTAPTAEQDDGRPRKCTAEQGAFALLEEVGYLPSCFRCPQAPTSHPVPSVPAPQAQAQA